MRLAKGTSKVWVAERRGCVVYVRGGTASAPGVPKAREHETEAAAQAYLEAERDKRLAGGYVMVDENAGLDAPHTVDGKVRERKVPARYAHLATMVRLLVRVGALDDDALEARMDTMARDALDADRAARAAREDPRRTLEERAREADVRARVAKEEEERGAPDSALRDLLGWVARTERSRLRAATTKSPWASLRDAFDALARERIVALHAAGSTQSDGWADVNEIAAQRRAKGEAPRGGCFYTEQDLERTADGADLLLTFGAYGELARGAEADEANRVLGRVIAAALRAHGLDVRWDEDPTRRIAVRSSDFV